METAVALRPHGSIRQSPHMGTTLERSCIIPYSTWSMKRVLPLGLGSRGGLLFSPLYQKRLLQPLVRSSETALAVTSRSVPSESSQGPLDKKPLQATPFPTAFESLVMEVCDETDVAELKVKVGGFEMHLKRNVGATVVPTPPIPSPSTPPPVPSEPMVDSVSATASPAVPPKPLSTASSPFSNALLSKATRLANLEASGSNAYVIVSSPTVGTFRQGRTVKGKKQPPICKEGDIIKEGHVIGYLDQFGSELPVRSDVAGEVLKLLYKDGEAVGYGDPLVAVLPSFHGIR